MVVVVAVVLDGRFFQVDSPVSPEPVRVHFLMADV